MESPREDWMAISILSLVVDGFLESGSIPSTDNNRL